MAQVTDWIDEVRSHPWAMEPNHLLAHADRIASITPERVLQASASGPFSLGQTETPFERRGSCAVIDISGELTDSVPSWYRYFGIAATSFASIKRGLAVAVADRDVSTIVLRVDSPGGRAQGTSEVGDAIAAAAKRKRVVAIVHGWAASAAYWLASQASEIVAAPDAFVGSIGCYFVVKDTSKAAEANGVTVHVIRAGEHKGVGEPGSPITAEHLADIQKLADGLCDLFVAGVAKGRRMSKDAVKALATGQVWLAAESKAQGLVDRVEAAGPALNRIEKETRMSDQKHDEEIAKAKSEVLAGERKRASEIRAAFPKHPAFAAAQIESGATLAEARGAFATVLEEELAAERKASAEARSELEKARAAKPAPAVKAPAPPAGEPLPRGGDPGQASAEGAPDFIALAQEYAKARNVSMTKAMTVVAARGKALEANPNAVTADPVLRKVTPAIHAEWVASQPRIKRDRSPYQRIARPNAAPAESQ